VSRPSKHSNSFHPLRSAVRGPIDWAAARPACLRQAARIVGTQDAHDVVQEAFVRAWASCERRALPERPLPWLLTITRNEALRARSRDRRDTFFEDRDELPDPRAGASLDDVALRVDVGRALRTLSAEDRKLLELRYEDDLTQPAAAAALGIPEGTAKVRLHRARGRLKGLLRADEVIG